MFRCTNCRGTKAIFYRYIDGFLLEKCSKCYLLHTRTSERSRAIYVNNKYSKSYTEDYKLALPKLYKRFKKHIQLIKKYNSGKRLLDVGCGTGYFLKYLSDKYKTLKIFGVEPNKILRGVARKNTKIRIKAGTLDSLPFPNAYFDIVTCYDVLEHSSKLNNNLNELKRVLKPQGLLFIQAPNYKSIMANITGDRWDWWCIPDHVLHFSYDTLITILKGHGFRILHSYTYEDHEDYFSNIKGVYSKNFILKGIYFMLKPLLLVIEGMGSLFNKGGLVVVLAESI